MNSKSEITNFLPLPKDDWLSKWNEIIIDPHIPIVDAHHHIWSRTGWVYGAEELTKDLISGHLITSTVFVQCREHYYQFGDEAFKPIGETEYIVQTANEAEELIKNNTAKNFNHKIKICEAIVGFADLTLGDRVAAVLEAHISASNHRFRGIRHSGARYEDGPITNTWPLPPNSLFLESNFIKGFAVLNKFNLSFDAWVYQNQLLDVYTLAKKFPKTKIVLNHVGGPLGINQFSSDKKSTFDSWKNLILELSTCPNIYIKLGGLGLVSCGFGFNKLEQPVSSERLAHAWRPWVSHCIDTFTPTRCMFESNFPVDKVTCSYPVLWNTFKRLTQEYSESEQANLLSNTAKNFYGLSQD